MAGEERIAEEQRARARAELYAKAAGLRVAADDVGAAKNDTVIGSGGMGSQGHFNAAVRDGGVDAVAIARARDRRRVEALVRRALGELDRMVAGGD